MRQCDALERALARAGRQPPRWMPRVSRLGLRTHRMLLGMSGGVRLHYLGAPRRSAMARIDSRLTVRLLLAEARAARAASLHVYLVCMMAAREFVARGMRTAQWLAPGRGRDASLRAPRGETGKDATLQILSHLVRSPDRGTSTWVRESQRRDMLRTLEVSRTLAGAQRFFRELRNRYVRSIGGRQSASQRDAPVPQGGLVTPMHSTIDVHAFMKYVVSARNNVLAAATATMPAAAVLRTLFGSKQIAYVPAVEAARMKHRTTGMPHPALPLQGPVPRRQVAPGERATARLSAFRLTGAPAAPATMQFRATMHATAHASAHVAPASLAMAGGYADTPAATLRYRRAPRAVVPDTKGQVKSQTRDLQQQVVRQVTQELAQNTPWRGQIEQAVLAPRLLRELTERVAGAIAGRQSLERYRRGL